MNSEISIERHGQKAVSYHFAGEKKRLRSTSNINLDKDKDRFSPSGPGQKDALLRELFAYVANWNSALIILIYDPRGSRTETSWGEPTRVDQYRDVTEAEMIEWLGAAARFKARATMRFACVGH